MDRRTAAAGFCLGLGTDADARTGRYRLEPPAPAGRCIGAGRAVGRGLAAPPFRWPGAAQSRLPAGTGQAHSPQHAHRQRGCTGTPLRRYRGDHRHPRAGRDPQWPASPGKGASASPACGRCAMATGRGCPRGCPGPGPDGDDRRASVADQNSSPCGEAFFGGSGGTKRLQSSHGHCSREALKPRRLLASPKRRASSCAYTPSPRMRLPNWLS